MESLRMVQPKDRVKGRHRNPLHMAICPASPIMDTIMDSLNICISGVMSVLEGCIGERRILCIGREHGVDVIAYTMRVSPFPETEQR